MPYLKGNIQARITDLREQNCWSKAELAERIGIDASRMGRIESGETKSVGDDVILALAKAFGVSTDFLPGVSDDPEPNNYDIKVDGHGFARLPASGGGNHFLSPGRADRACTHRKRLRRDPERHQKEDLRKSHGEPFRGSDQKRIRSDQERIAEGHRKEIPADDYRQPDGGRCGHGHVGFRRRDHGDAEESEGGADPIFHKTAERENE